MIKFEDFMKLDIRTARILDAEEVPGADKLYLLTVDIGDETRRMIAGIKPWYAREEIIGKNVVVVANLEPKVIRGVESRGMVLATMFDNNLAVLAPDKETPPGSKVS